MSQIDATRNGRQFEQQIADVLDRVLPHAYLSGVPVFRADAAMDWSAMANELDFIAHLKTGRRHTILIIECKSCKVTGAPDARGNYGNVTPGGPWLAHYRETGEKSIKDQLGTQRSALLTNIEPLDGEVRVHAVIVASHAQGLNAKKGEMTCQPLPSFDLSLVSPDMFETFMRKRLKEADALRVQQSEILRRIRLGQVVPVLGHPEVYNAIEYARRCRFFIDSEIFRHLDFKPERWAINGSAGMGKSVLLIYSTMVLITDRYVAALRDGTRFLQTYTEDATRVGLPPLDKRRVWVVAHTEKQKEMLKKMFGRFTDLYGEVDTYNEYRRVKPEFRVFSEISTIECNVLLVDEAHDLGPDGEKKVREWHTSSPGNYLVIACDRHQKLRLSRDSTRMIDGIDFSLCTRKLTRNYRNPFPAYAGSLGLLFRWFADAGPKILPKPSELRGEFGFGEVLQDGPGKWILSARNDAHPANNWSHMLSAFPSAEAAHQQLSEFPLLKDQVLWIRFSEEDSDFNYEDLQKWSYHSVHGADAADLLDKYVKGQEFPVVVIEGLPAVFSWITASERWPLDLARARSEMWQARRMVYLAASRANVFLYFILPADIAKDVATEFDLMFRQLARQSVQESPSGTVWKIQFNETPDVETFASYVDVMESEPSALPTDIKVAAPAGELTSAATAINPPAHPAEAAVTETPTEIAVVATLKMENAEVIPPAEIPPSIPAAPKPAQSKKDLLGSVASLEEVAKALDKRVDQLIRTMAAKGIQKVQANTRVNVAYVIEALKEADHLHKAQPPKQPAPVPPPSFSAADLQAQMNSLKTAAPVVRPPYPPQASTQQWNPASPPPHKRIQIGISLSQLALFMHLRQDVVTEFLDSTGESWRGDGTAMVNADAAEKLLTRLIGNRDLVAFNQLESARITVRSLANHLGLRASALTKDLMNEKRFLDLNDRLPYAQVVKLCHYYGKQLPNIS